MPRRRDRGLIDAWERWSPRAAPPKAAPAIFVTIARTFEQIDRVMLEEIRADKDRAESSRFNSSRLDNIRDTDVTSYIQKIQQNTSHTSSDADVSAYLSDYNCITAWGWVHGAVLEHQGATTEARYLSWTQARSRANELLDLARVVLEAYDSEECRDLLIPEREGVGAGVEAKLNKLSSFNTIYCRPDYDEKRQNTGPGNHTFYYLFNQFFAERRENTKAKRKADHVRAHQTVSKHSE